MFVPYSPTIQEAGRTVGRPKLPKNNQGRDGVLDRNAASHRFQEALSPLGVPMVDLQPVLFAQPDRAGTFFLRTVHLTPRGHEVVAHALFDFLQSSGLASSVPR